MIEQELLDALRDTTASRAIVEICDSEASKILALLRQTFVSPVAGQWWWDGLSCESVVIQYGDSDGLSVVRELLEMADSVTFVPTDDESPPWPIFVGHIERIVDVLEELRFFEYFLSDENNTWIVFDTHHNSLVVAGALVDRAKEIQASLS